MRRLKTIFTHFSPRLFWVIFFSQIKALMVFHRAKIDFIWVQSEGGKFLTNCLLHYFFILLILLRYFLRKPLSRNKRRFHCDISSLNVRIKKFIKSSTDYTDWRRLNTSHLLQPAIRAFTLFQLNWAVKVKYDNNSMLEVIFPCNPRGGAMNA